MPEDNPASFDAGPQPAEIPAVAPTSAAEVKPHGGQSGGDSGPPDLNRPALEPIADEDSKPTSVVGIGASAGGVTVLQEFFGLMPPDSGLGFVVVMHLLPDHESSLAEILQARSKMPIVQVTEPVRMEANHVYVIPPNKHLTMSDSTLLLQPGQQEPGRRVAIDLFFRTLAEHYGERAVCIVLSGTDSDGVIGLKHIKAQGGVTIAQDPAEAEYDSMPRSAIETGMVDWVLPVKEMVPRLLDYVNNEKAMKLPREENGETPTLPDLAPRGLGGPLVSRQTDDPDDESALHDVLAFLRTQTGHDFSQYRRATILRRVARRLQVHLLEDLRSYLEYLYTHPNEARALLHDLLIGVTHFFRDQPAFLALEAQMPHVFAGKGPNDRLRVWVPGCATGEEAYSVAILLAEQEVRTTSPPRIQVFATDLDEDALRTARQGIYPQTIEADVSQDRLRQFFFSHHGNYRIRKEVRELVLFADHDLLRDSPFSRLDLITCRNLLIYLKPEAQHRAMGIFHFALRPSGILMLSGSEHVDDNHPLFAVLDERHRLYIRRATPRPPVVNLFTPTPRLRKVPGEPVLPRLATSLVAAEFTPPPDEQGKRTLAQRRERSLGNLHAALLENYAPPSVVVDENHEILHMSAKADEFLHFSAGEPSTNLLKLVDDTLRPELRTALFRAAQDGENINVPRIRIVRDDQMRVIDLHVRPALTDEGGGRVFLIIFEQQPSTAAEQAQPAPQQYDEVTQHLEQQLQHLRQQLAVTIEQSEASQEELKASNEELQAMNEELRSATEELETGKEELQSVNEVLTTLNYELKSNTDELTRTNSDLQNLFAATDIATVFLDRQFRIKRFTPRLQELFNVIPGDVGRQLADITNKLNYPGLIEQAERVLATLEKQSAEIQANGRWFVVRMAPYRSLEEKIDGVVISFIDITGRKNAEESLRENEEQFGRAIEDAPIPIIMYAEDGQVLQISRTWTELTGYSAEEIPTFDAWLNTAYGEGADQVRAHMHELFKGHKRALNIEFPIRTRGGETRHWSFSASAPGTLRDGRRFIVGMAVDLTGRQLAEDELRAGELRYRTLFALVPVAVYSTNAEGLIQDFNQRAVELWGRAPEKNAEKFCGSRRRFYSDGRPMASDEYPIAKVLRGEELSPPESELILEQENGTRKYVIVSPSVLKNEQGEIIGAIDCLHDITARKEAEEALRKSEERFRTVADNIPQLIWTNEAAGKADYFNRRWYDYTGLSYEKSAGPGWQAVVHPEDELASTDKWKQALANGEVFDCEYRLRRTDGAYRWFIGRNVPLRDGRGQIVSWFGSATDIDGRKRVEAALRETEEHLHLLIEGAADYAMFIVNPSNVITYWSKGAERVFGWTAEEAVGQSGELVFTPEDRAREAEEKEIEVALRDGRAPDKRWHLRKDGKRVWIDGVMHRLSDETTGALRGFAKIARDASEQRRADEELRHARDQLEQRVLERTADLMATNNELERTMAQRELLEHELLEISERERRRIGQDLHDVVCQELTATALFLKSAGNKIDSQEAAKSLNEAAEIVNRNVAIARDLARGFQPTLRASGGFPAALRSLCNEASDRPGIHCTLKLPRAVRIRDETIALNLFRIAQEAVRNAVAHSGGDEIIICIERERDLIRLVVEDNGKGYRPRKRSKGLGVHIMEYRTNVLGGRFGIVPRPKGGAKVVCEVPVKK